MKNTTTLVFIFFCFLICYKPLTSNAQDQSFSQFYAAPLFLNPANAGQKTATYFSTNYKHQWKGANLANSQLQFTAIQPIFMRVNRRLQHAGGVGLSVYQETLGEGGSLKNLSVNLSGAYNLFLDRDYRQMLSFGIQGGLRNSRVDFGSLRWGSQWDEYFGFDENKTPPDFTNFNQSVFTPTIDAGMTWFYNPEVYGKFKKGYYLGFSAFNLTKANNNFNKQVDISSEVLFKANGGMMLQLDNTWSISPNFLIQKKGESNQYNVGMYASHKVVTSRFSRQSVSLMIGSWYRFNDSFIFNIGAEANNITFGFSYDMNTSYLEYNVNGGGAFEVSLAYSLPEKNRKRFRTPLF